MQPGASQPGGAYQPLLLEGSVLVTIFNALSASLHEVLMDPPPQPGRRVPCFSQYSDS